MKLCVIGGAGARSAFLTKSLVKSARDIRVDHIVLLDNDQQKLKTYGEISRELARRLEAAYLEQWVGTSLPVLFEEEKNGLWRGHAPNYVEVMAHGEGLHNVIQDVKITEIHGDGLLGELL